MNESNPYMERWNAKLDKLLKEILDKKQILEKIYKDGEDMIKKLENEIEEENKITESEEEEFQQTVSVLENIQEKIKAAEEELAVLDNKILNSTSHTEVNETIQKLEKELMLLKEKNAKIKKDNQRRLNFFFCPF